MASEEILDVVIVGAGISGVGAACHFEMDRPGTNYAILERRDQIGGTWDLFKYPGIRSDSDMYTLGYDFKPWMKHQTLADGPSIKEYLHETATEYGVFDKIRFGVKITRSEFDTSRGLWTFHTLNEKTGETGAVKAKFALMCTGYYKYDQGYTPDFPDMDSFEGTIIHPQHWPENLDYSGKRVVVIGSGATAATLVPAMADKAGHVTMLQRSPTFYGPVSSVDKLSKFLSAILPDKLAFQLTRLHHIWIQRLTYTRSMNKPLKMRKLLLDKAQKALQGKVDMKHFEPAYNPWEQRLCAIPDEDLFKVLREGDASIVTDHVDRFTKTGIQLKSGQHLDADIIISATGLNMELFSGMDIFVDGEEKKPGERLTYKSLMLEDVPNLAFIMGYVNASWTLKVDIALDYLIKLMNTMQANGTDIAVPRANNVALDQGNVFGHLSSGYVARAQGKMPKQGMEAPWRVTHDYKFDKVMLTEWPVEDGNLEFTRSRSNVVPLPEQVAAE